MRACLFLPATLMAGMLLIQPALAQGTTDMEPPPDLNGTFAFSLENDMFGGSDRYYTSGFQFAYRSPSADLPGPLDWLNQRLDWLMGPGTLRWGWALGQSIYTPQDTETIWPDPRDRPYAGYLYGALSLTRTSERTSNLFELQAGVVGPSALGEFVQNNYHDIINIDQTNGWKSQLKDEPAFTALYEKKWRVPLGTVSGIETEVIPAASVSLGNVQTYGGIGALARFGQGLDADYGPPRIRPALAGSTWIQPRQDFGWYVFAGVDGRAIARDIFLDGNTWRESRSVDKRILVGDLQAGVAVLWRGVRLSYTQVWRSEEFYGQAGTQSFGSLSVSFRF
ncbi:lipid A deacylase LpxR family protein [Teichococcus oryzae]|uniref:Lipid A deacylase LpxR family protein n=1 Tax=Teichococcus oryzae TaxID=1608942 RepID=A0A5B2TLW6_9PROT|nr:lipid A deacylase LpxR family protein [Pseudoroseomonas oryzae]KAA2215184.1 lipid A deacylase LpxR family protein [Pseudoroseomonas oryzae]